MPKALRLVTMLDRLIALMASFGGWMLIVLTVVVVFDVVTRRYFVFYSTFLQELEWHLHTIAFAFALGFTYLRNAHVRIDILRDKLGRRRQAAIELAGLVFLFLPFIGLLTFLSVEYAAQAWIQHEGSVSLQGIQQRWAIKATLPVGFLLLILAGVGTAVRSWFVLVSDAACQPELGTEPTKTVAG